MGLKVKGGQPDARKFRRSQNNTKVNVRHQKESSNPKAPNKQIKKPNRSDRAQKRFHSRGKPQKTNRRNPSENDLKKLDDQMEKYWNKEPEIREQRLDSQMDDYWKKAEAES